MVLHLGHCDVGLLGPSPLSLLLLAGGVCRPATQVSISDTTWSPEAFEFVEGQPAATVESIEAGESFQHTFVLRPKSPGELSAPAATVSYTPFPNAEVQSGISTTIQGLTVFSPLENRVAQAVAVGRYLSLGYCQTVGDWMRVGFAVAAILVAIFGNSAFGSIQAANARRKRKAAIKELQES